MKELNLNSQNLTELTESDLTALCHLRGFKPNELYYLNLKHNKLTNINFIQENTPFINLKTLILSYNKDIKDIRNIQYLKNLEVLYLYGLKLNKNYKKEIQNILKISKLSNLGALSTLWS